MIWMSMVSHSASTTATNDMQINMQ